MVVPVLITSCHVSENLNRGPVRAQTMTTVNAVANPQLLPDHRVTPSATWANFSLTGLPCDFLRSYFSMIPPLLVIVFPGRSFQPRAGGANEALPERPGRGLVQEP